MVLPAGVYSYGLFWTIDRHISGTLEHKSAYRPSVGTFSVLYFLGRS